MGEVVDVSAGYVDEIDQSGCTLVSEYEEGGVEMYVILKNGLSVVLADFLILLPALSYQL